MENKQKVILVIGATGNQGGGVARELLNNGHKIKALTRNTSSSSSEKLKKMGAELVEGDLANVSSIDQIMKNVDAVFSVQYADPSDPDVELRNAKNTFDSAKRNGVSQIVHTSVAGSNSFPRWKENELLAEYYDQKFAIEEMIRRAGFKQWTILHPCWFMEGFKEPAASIMAPQLKNGLLFGPLSDDTPIKLNCSEDTARFARNAFERPEEFNGADINVCGDEISMKEIAEILSDIKNEKIVYRKMSSEESIDHGLLEGTIAGLEFMEAIPGYGFDIKETQKYGVELKTFRTWVNENKSEIIVNKSLE